MIKRLLSYWNCTVHPWDLVKTRFFIKGKKSKNSNQLHIGFCSVFPPYQNGAAAGAYYIVKELAKRKDIKLYLIPIKRKIDKKLFSFMPLRITIPNDPTLDVIIYWCLGQNFQEYTKKSVVTKIGWQTMHREPEHALGEQQTLDHMKKMDLVLAITQWAYDCYRRQIDNVVYLPFGVDPAQFKMKNISDNKKDDENVTEKDGKKNFTCLFVSRIHYYKGIMSFLDAVPLVLEKDSNIYFRLVAPIDNYSPYLGEIKQKLDALKTQYPHNIIAENKWISYSAIPKYYENADLLIFPSNNEGFGIPLIEAMSSGVPCIVLDKKPMSEIVVDKKTGFCLSAFEETSHYHGFAFPNPKEIAKKIIYLKKNKRKMREFRENGRARVLSSYNLPLIIDKLINQCRKLVCNWEK